MPITEPGTAAAYPGHAASTSNEGQRPQPLAGRCIGALLLSLPTPAQLDVQHASWLLALAAALAPGMAQAAAPLREQCNLILGVEEQQQRWQGEGRWQLGSESEGEGSGSELMLTDTEEEGLEGEEQAALAAQPAGWVSGACRDTGAEPPDDPGSASAALLAVQQSTGDRQEAEATAAGTGGERRPEQSADASGSLVAPASAAVLAAQQGGAGSGAPEAPRQPRQLEQPPPESPSASKARARAEAGLATISTSSASSTGSGAAGPSTSAGLPHGGPPQELLKRSPAESEGSEASPLGQAGASWRRLLRFADPRLERRFALWHHAQLLQACCEHPSSCFARVCILLPFVVTSEAAPEPTHQASLALAACRWTC